MTVKLLSFSICRDRQSPPVIFHGYVPASVPFRQCPFLSNRVQRVLLRHYTVDRYRDSLYVQRTVYVDLPIKEVYMTVCLVRLVTTVYNNSIILHASILFCADF